MQVLTHSLLCDLIMGHLSSRAQHAVLTKKLGIEKIFCVVNEMLI
jgi:hypothetical protein